MLFNADLRFDMDFRIGRPILPKKPLKCCNDSHIVENGRPEFGHEPSYLIYGMLGPCNRVIEEFRPRLPLIDLAADVFEADLNGCER